MPGKLQMLDLRVCIRDGIPCEFQGQIVNGGVVYIAQENAELIVRCCEHVIKELQHKFKLEREGEK